MPKTSTTNTLRHIAALFAFDRVLSDDAIDSVFDSIGLRDVDAPYSVYPQLSPPCEALAPAVHLQHLLPPNEYLRVTLGVSETRPVVSYRKGDTQNPVPASFHADPSVQRQGLTIVASLSSASPQINSSLLTLRKHAGCTDIDEYEVEEIYVPPPWLGGLVFLGACPDPLVEW